MCDDIVRKRCFPLCALWEQKGKNSLCLTWDTTNSIHNKVGSNQTGHRSVLLTCGLHPTATVRQLSTTKVPVEEMFPKNRAHRKTEGSCLLFEGHILLPQLMFQFPQQNLVDVHPQACRGHHQFFAIFKIKIHRSLTVENGD